MNRVHPVFAANLAAFSGQLMAKPPHKVLIAVDPMEVEVQTRSNDCNGPAEYCNVTAPDWATKQAIERVLAYPSVLDMIQAELTKLIGESA